MAELTLISPSQRPIQPLVEGALQNELRLLEAGVRLSDLLWFNQNGHFDKGAKID